MHPRTEYHREYRKAHLEQTRNTEAVYRARKKGLLPPPVEPTALDRFEQNYIPVTESGCWLWTELVNHKGYAVMKIKQRSVLMHRWSYEHFVGPIPEGLTIDHLCRVRCCVNPLHLEPVTNLENRQRGVKWYWENADKTRPTHCPKGHEYTPENTVVSGKLGQYRMCRTCRNAECLAAYYARKAKSI